MDFNSKPLENFTKQELFDYMNKELADVKNDEKIVSFKGMHLFVVIWFHFVSLQDKLN